ncbi:MAG: cell envelope biosis protein OmpA [Gammaproteobacteria bacterium]|nr:cell envelope biosis protein OmpA [Gammaproteobacteria bacterium]
MRFIVLSRKYLVLAATAALLAGCYTSDPYTGDRQMTRTSMGAGIGALTGAVAGMLTGGDARQHRKNALIGAGIGALAGGATGNYMDRQEGKLRAQLQGTGVSVVRNGNDITLKMPGNITYRTDSADLQANFYNVLNSVVLVLKQYDKTIVEVAGHTDNTGAADYNRALSERRATSVAQYLESQGINTQRVMTVGAGEDHPIAPNTTPEGRQANRRVELTLEPITQG